MKLKEKLNGIFQSVKKAMERFPVTIITMFLFMVFLAIVLDTEIISDEWLEYISCFTIYFSVGSFFTESIYSKKSKKSIFYYILFAILAISFVVIQNIDFESKFMEYHFWKFIVCYISILSILSIYFLAKKSEKDFKEYVLNVFINFMKTSIVYAILSIGIAIITAIFIYLILENVGYFLIIRLEILLLGLYYFPKLMYCFVDIKANVNSFFKVLIKYVLMSLVVISFVIIYMYIAKILILRDMPKNQIFRILSALFIIGMPIWTMAHYFKDENLWYKISLKLPIAFIPFIFLQMYTIGIRISNNGLTPLRYLCIALIIFEIIYVLVYILKKEKLEIMLLVFNGIILISLLVPGINMFKVSNISQANILKIYKNKSNYTDEEKEKIYGAYKYLNYSDDGDKYINDILTKDEIEEVKNFKKKDYYRNALEIISTDEYNGKIDLKGYNELYYVTASDYSIQKSVKKTFSDLELKNLDLECNINIDLSKEFKEYIEKYLSCDGEDFDKYFENNNVIKFENKKFVIKHFSIYYDTDSNIVESYSIQGYILEK